jgi:iron complex outermembrane receptor protein
MSFTQINITKLALFSFLAISFSLAAIAQDADSTEEVVSEETVADSDESAEDEVELTKISVTGSRIKRSEVEGPQPLVVLTKEQIEQGGFISVYDAVSSVSQNTGDFQGAIASGGFTPGAETINLRDFGPGNTLVLVNGKRRADYPFPYSGNDSVFNWNSIPISLVERIEILSSGASAIYGSDAVAGVVNVILIDGLEETSVRVRGGTHLDGGGDNYNFEISGGGYTDRLSYAWGLEHSQQDPIQGMNRKDIGILIGQLFILIFLVDLIDCHLLLVTSLVKILVDTELCLMALLAQAEGIHIVVMMVLNLSLLETTEKVTQLISLLLLKYLII